MHHAAPGFTLEVFADDLPGARSLTLSARRHALVGSRDNGVVYIPAPATRRARRSRASWRAGSTAPTASPSATAPSTWRRSRASYGSTISRRASTGRRRPSSSPTGIRAIVHHGWKFIAFGPDGWLYVRSARRATSACRGPLHETITRMKPTAARSRFFARGVRQQRRLRLAPRLLRSVVHDNGREWMGDDRPPDELNHAPSRGCISASRLHGRALADPQFGREKRCAASRRRRRNWGRTLRHSACASTRARCSRRSTAPHLHRRARLVEPQHTDRVSRDHGAAGR